MCCRILLFLPLCVLGTWRDREWYKNQCGKWQETYRSRHDSVRMGLLPPSYVVFANGGGLADKLKGLTSAFYFGLLTGRAIQIADPAFQNVFRTINVDWTTEVEVGTLIKSARSSNSSVSLQLTGWRASGNEKLRNIFRAGNLSQVGFRSEVVVFDTCYSFIDDLFHNPYHSQYLRSLGLRAETAVGCALVFLFEIKPFLLRPMLPVITEIKLQPLIIGIQIRVGDSVFLKKNRKHSASDYMRFFDCAQNLERHAVAGQTASWLLVSDSEGVRSSALELFPGKLLTATNNHIAHTARNKMDLSGWGNAAAELWMFSHANYFVVSRYSGFGKVSAALAMNPTAVFVVDNKGLAVNSSGASCISQTTSSWLSNV
ncbi:hypothetical protein DUNSADRAFT_15698 [Dunaliella salina]|uniref:Uncharacterized protein n=1 Tax=Dunaliella salina TaxID=3046 RepID=A0ABQ7G4X2_DUNSA|nr:hypothetical protein DUNSADRAFT_15698 [Dunaliella salina]|eukprot:KAF5829642.1 hypothetical protein DUNSADRAFT_15698 [Dunaliella salina]